MNDPLIILISVLIYVIVFLAYMDDYFDLLDEQYVYFFVVGAPIGLIFGDWISENLIAAILIGAILGISYQLNQLQAIADSIRAVLEESRRRRYKVSDEDLTLMTGAMTDHEVIDMKNIEISSKRKKARQDKQDRMKDYQKFYFYVFRCFWVVVISIPLFAIAYSVRSEATFLQILGNIITSIRVFFE